MQIAEIGFIAVIATGYEENTACEGAAFNER